MSGATTVWSGKYLSMKVDGQWEYVSRTGGMTAAVLLAEHEGRILLVEQFRVPIGRRVLELPAGLVGDEGPSSVEETAIKELEEETGFLADRAEPLGEFFSSPGMASEGFTLVRMHGVRPGGRKSEEEIEVHLVPQCEVAAFVAARRAVGTAIDVRILLLLGSEILGR